MIRKMKFFGEKIGVAFQLRDELFDFVSNGTSKPLGIDLKEKGMSVSPAFKPSLSAALTGDSQQDTEAVVAMMRDGYKVKINESDGVS